MDNDDDPVLHTTLPSENGVDNSDYLYSLQANTDEINFTDDDVQGEEIELFGRSYTVSDASDDNNVGDSALVLFGSQEEVDIDSGEESTVVINDEEVTLEVVAVTDEDTAAIRVNGELRQRDEGQSFNVNDQDVRLTEVIQTNNQESAGVVKFAIGSEELQFENGEPVQDSDDDDIDGTHVQINGGSYSVGDGVSSIEVFVGSDDDDMDWLEAGDSFSHDLFENVVVRFGGLNPDAEEGGNDVGTVEFGTDGDDTATVELTSEGGDDATVEFAHDSNLNSGQYDGDLADSDDDSIIVAEGAEIQEDEYFVSDAGDFAHLWEVTDIDRDTDDDTGDLESDDEAEIDLRDAVTGNSVTVDLDAEGGGSDGFDYVGTEIIDGQTYHFALDGDSTGDNDLTGGFVVAWGEGSPSASGDGNAAGPSVDVGDDLSLFTALDTESGSSVAFAENVTVTASSGTDLLMPSTESTGDQRISYSSLPTSGDTTVDAGQVTYIVENATGGVDDYTVGAQAAEGPSALVIQSEDEDDAEHAYAVTPGEDTGDEEVGIGDSGDIEYTGNINGAAGYSSNTETLESDDDLDVAYSGYGTYSVQDTDDQGGLTLDIPYGQSTVGVAVTDQDGSVSASGGAGSVETQMPTGWPSTGMLDSDVTSSHRQNDNMILVGGPAVNGLVSDLADEGDTWSTDQYSQGTAIIDLVTGAFSEGNDALVVAGQSAADTREATDFISNYADHQDELSGTAQHELTTAQSTQ